MDGISMALTNKEIELVYLGASIAAGCKPCTSYHFRRVKEAEASDNEIQNAISDSAYIRDIAKTEMESYAMNLLGISTQSEDHIDNQNTDRLTVLVSIGAAFAVNCTSTLDTYIALAESMDITNEDINNIFGASKLVKMKAASHVDKIAVRFEYAKSTEGDTKRSDGCGCSEDTSNVQTKSKKFEAKIENGCC
jgi:AhpD family alkylhydroperoxidase